MIECQQSRIDFRLRTRYLDEQAANLDDALARIERHCARKEPVSIGLLGNAAEILPELPAKRGIKPDLVTDQTSAHDLINGYLPVGWTRRAMEVRESKIPRGTPNYAMPRRNPARPTCGRCWIFTSMGVPTVDYGNNIRQVALEHGVANAFDFPGFVPGVHPPAVLRRQGAIPLGRAFGRSGGHLQDRCENQGAVPGESKVHRWLDMARERIAFQGLPARICWLGLGERHRGGARVQ